MTADSERALLDETFQRYLQASGSALRTFVDYKFGKASERQVAEANRREIEALDAHLAAIKALGANEAGTRAEVAS